MPLFVVFLPLGRVRAQLVTAREMTQKERRLYRREEGIAVATQEPKTKKRLPDFEKIVSVRITEADLGQLKRIAAERGLGHTTLIRTWIKEKLHREPSPDGHQQPIEAITP